MIRKTMNVGPLQCNCVVLGCEATREAVVIDPGDEAETITKALAAEGLTVKYLLHTHAHFDHIGATSALRAKFNAPICLHKEDEVLYNNLPMQGRMFGIECATPLPVEKYLEDQMDISFGNHRLEVLFTPGHTPGGVCFRMEGGGEQIVFAGDTLFQQSIGRTDLWGGDYDTLITSIRNRLLPLDDETIVIPGHGPNTSIGMERRGNPFLNR